MGPKERKSSGEPCDPLIEVETHVVGNVSPENGRAVGQRLVEPVFQRLVVFSGQRNALADVVCVQLHPGLECAVEKKENGERETCVRACGPRCGRGKESVGRAACKAEKTIAAGRRRRPGVSPLRSAVYAVEERARGRGQKKAGGRSSTHSRQVPFPFLFLARSPGAPSFSICPLSACPPFPRLPAQLQACKVRCERVEGT